MSINLLLDGLKVDEILDAIFQDATIPDDISRVTGSVFEVANSFRENLLKEMQKQSAPSLGLSELLAKYAFACHCLLNDQWESGPSVSFLSFRSLLLDEYWRLRKNPEFTKVVVRFKRASPLSEPFVEVLVAYFRGCFFSCEDSQHIERAVNGLILLCWVITIASNLELPSTVSLGMLSLFRGDSA